MLSENVNLFLLCFLHELTLSSNKHWYHIASEYVGKLQKAWAHNNIQSNSKPSL